MRDGGNALRCAGVMELIDSDYESVIGYLPPGCCWSCHEDEDYGYPLLSPDINGSEAEVCCAMARAWEVFSARR